jgi:CheY-like chemotaxis protein
MDRKKILIVDDEPDLIIYIDTLLSDNGYDVLQAESAREAREIMEQTRPDLVCLDIMMPKKSGIAFYREFKLDENFKDIPAIFITAFSMERDFEGHSFKKLIRDKKIPEPCAFIEKPVIAAELLEAIKRALG